MSKQEYSLQRLDAELYHELAHNMAVVGTEGYRPGWFTEGLGTWAQSSIINPGSYTGIRAQMDDVFWVDDAYTTPDAFAGYGKTALFFWWLVERYGANGFHSMIAQCFGWDQQWSSESDLDARGFIPWTGRDRTLLAEDFYASVRSGWRVGIPRIVQQMNVALVTYSTTTPIPEFVISWIAVLPSVVLAVILIDAHRRSRSSVLSS